MAFSRSTEASPKLSANRPLRSGWEPPAGVLPLALLLEEVSPLSLSLSCVFVGLGGCFTTEGVVLSKSSKAPVFQEVQMTNVMHTTGI